MRIIKEGYTEHTKVVVAPDYVTIQRSPIAHGDEPVHLSVDEAREVVEWLSHELNRVLPETLLIVPKLNTETWENKLVQDLKDLSKDKPFVAPMGPIRKQEPVYEPGPRSASQTVEVKVGDPNLAYRASGGRTGMAGDGDTGVMDLGALVLKAGNA